MLPFFPRHIYQGEFNLQVHRSQLQKSLRGRPIIKIFISVETLSPKISRRVISARHPTLNGLAGLFARLNLW